MRPPLWYASRCCLRRSSTLALTTGRCASRKSSAWRAVNCVWRGHRYARTLQHRLLDSRAVNGPHSLQETHRMHGFADHGLPQELRKGVQLLGTSTRLRGVHILTVTHRQRQLRLIIQHQTAQPKLPATMPYESLEVQ